MFYFEDSRIWIGSLKLSVLRGGYLPSEVNMLKNILKTLDISKRDYLQLNWFHSDQ